MRYVVFVSFIPFSRLVLMRADSNLSKQSHTAQTFIILVLSIDTHDDRVRSFAMTNVISYFGFAFFIKMYLLN